MKCPSIACLFPTSPPSHQITTLTLSPPSLYTGSSSGSIIHWSTLTLQPLSLLCSHSSPITSLHISSSSLISSCSSSLLCLWSPSSHRCLRRTKLPPWTGTPYLISHSLSHPNHICIACKPTTDSSDNNNYAVLIVHPSTLTILRTVFHGTLGSGWDIKCMAVTAKDVILVDRSAKLQFLDLDGELGSSVEGFDDVRDVAISDDGNMLGVVFGSCCEFRLVAGGTTIGKIYSEKNLVGGMFVNDGFVVWSSNGGAVVYGISSLDGVFSFEIRGEVPGLEYELDANSSVFFCQSDSGVLRVESVCFEVGGALLWKPRVTSWEVGSGKLSRLVSEGGFLGGKEGQDERIVSSSVVLSQNVYAPYGIAYGFYNGAIEVVRFVNVFPEVNSSSESPKQPTSPCILERSFSGHTGAVLCLAAHTVTKSSGEQDICRVLISGSMDWTVRIWDLDSGSLLSVLHHHVAPVKQIVLSSPSTDRPWKHCFLSVGEDCCIALVSFETLRVERIFPGHPIYPSMVAWDSIRGYLACLCRNISALSDLGSVLYLWDVKSGARERIIRGTASLSMYDHFCRGIHSNSISGSTMGGTTSASPLLLPFVDDPSFIQPNARRTEKEVATRPTAGMSKVKSADLLQAGRGKQSFFSAAHDISSDLAGNSSKRQASLSKVRESKTHSIKSSCPFAGIASLEFDLSSLMSSHFSQSSDKPVITHDSKHENTEPTLQHGTSNDSSCGGRETMPIKESMEECLLRFSLSFLHLWDVDQVLDKLLMEEMDICKPEGLYVASGVAGDKGSLTLMFPTLHATLELWKSSSEFCAMRSLVIVSLAQRMISLSHTSTTASSALAAFYTRNFAEEVPNIKPPLLQLLVSFWQDPSEHVRMAARSLFHCAAPRAIPHALCAQRTGQLMTPNTPSTDTDLERPTETVESEKSSMVVWLDSFETHEWISCIGGTSQDAMASHIIVAAALVVWYPSIVKDNLANLVVSQLVKLVMSMNDRYSLTAAELLAEGMENTWKACLGHEIPRLVADIFFQIECLTGTPANNATEHPMIAANMREALVEILLPSLAMADIAGFLNVIEDQIWSTSSDSPVHLVSLKTLIRVVRGSPKPLAPYLDKVVNYVLQTMDPGNLVMRKACVSSSMVTLREITRVFPMVALNESTTRLAVGDAIGDTRNVSIRVYDIERFVDHSGTWYEYEYGVRNLVWCAVRWGVTTVKILDASGTLGLPSLLEGALNTRIATAISALSFSPDGEGLVAFSENGLMIRWWSLGSAWWEKLSRSLVPVQCTKLIFVPPWEGFSPNSSRSSIMASIGGHDKRINSKAKAVEVDDADTLKLIIHNLDLSYRLQWVGGRNVLLTRHGQELGTFLL